MENDFPLIILISLYGLIILTLLGLWFTTYRRRNPLAYRSAVKAKSRLEQKLILEAIAAFAGIGELKAISESIGKHASEMTGYDRWCIWLQEDGAYDMVAASEEIDDRSGCGFIANEETDFIAWIRMNAGPVVVSSNATCMINDGGLRAAVARFEKGLLLPFIDGPDLLGFVVLGGRTFPREQRSIHFLSLYGSTAAMMIKKVRADLAEREMQRSQQRAEKMSALGKLAAGMAHEIRNPLTFLSVSIEHLEESKNLSPEEKELMGEMIGEVRRINKHIKELLSLGRSDDDVFSPVDIGGLIESSVRLVETRARDEGIGIELALGLEGALVFGSEDKLRQLVVNLLLNAFEALEGIEGGRVAIAACIAGSQAVITFSDNGRGVPVDQRERIFEPFFTTKESGTGLGLALCFNIVRAHGGTIELTAADAPGACFEVRLPLYSEGETAESRGEGL